MTSPPLGYYYGPTIQAATVHEDAEMGATYRRLAQKHAFFVFMNAEVEQFERDVAEWIAR